MSGNEPGASDGPLIRKMTASRPDAVSLSAVSRSAAVLTAAAALAQIVGFVRELFLAANIGASVDLDALLIALVLPTTLAGTLTTGATRALVPIYIDTDRESGLTEARRFAATVLMWATIGGLAIAVLLVILADPIIAVTGPGLSSRAQQTAVAYLRLVAPLASLAASTAILLAVCQAEERFLAVAVASVVGPVATLLTMLLLWDSFGLTALAAGSVIGPVGTLLVLVVATRRGWATPSTSRTTKVRLRGFVRHAGPITVGTVILQLNVIGDRAIASLLGPGAVSALRYADVLVRAPISAIGPAWGQAIYPALVRAASGRTADGLGYTSERSARYLAAVFIPVAMLTAAVAPLAVGVAYGRGAFTADDVLTTSRVVAGFAPLVVIVMMLTVLTGAHNARRRGKLLLVGGGVNVAINLTLDLLLGRWIGVAGIAVASSIAQGVVAALFLLRLARSEDAFPLRPIAKTSALAIAASAPASAGIGFVVWTGLSPSGTGPGLAALVVFGVLGLAGYVAASSLLGMDEPRSIVRSAALWLIAIVGRAGRGS